MAKNLLLVYFYLSRLWRKKILYCFLKRECFWNGICIRHTFQRLT